jgi:hypothetical protein
MEAQVYTWVNPRGICGEKVAKKWHWDRFFSEFFGFPRKYIIPPSLSTLISFGG